MNKIKPVHAKTEARSSQWVDGLDDEDLAFIRRFVLASGSLKELAQAYGISYPTVRLRLDRVIEKVKLLDRPDAMGPFELALRLAHAEGRIDVATLKVLLDAHRAEIVSTPAAQDAGERSAR